MIFYSVEKGEINEEINQYFEFESILHPSCRFPSSAKKLHERAEINMSIMREASLKENWKDLSKLENMFIPDYGIISVTGPKHFLKMLEEAKQRMIFLKEQMNAIIFRVRSFDKKKKNKKNISEALHEYLETYYEFEGAAATVFGIQCFLYNSKKSTLIGKYLSLILSIFNSEKLPANDIQEEMNNFKQNNLFNYLCDHCLPRDCLWSPFVYLEKVKMLHFYSQFMINTLLNLNTVIKLKDQSVPFKRYIVDAVENIIIPLFNSSRRAFLGFVPPTKNTL